MKIIALFLLSTSLIIGIPLAQAGEQPQQNTAPDDSLPAFRAGGHEVELRGGALYSFLNSGVNKPVLNYSLAAVRFGWMWNDVRYSGLFRGNSEILFETFEGSVFKGPGNFAVGGQLIWRYNFVQPGARLIPYFQLGGGGLYNDIYHDPVQHLIGEGFEFVLHGAFGARYMVNDRWAMSFEGEYRHISNAGLASRNQGLNSFGGSVGLNWLF